MIHPLDTTARTVLYEDEDIMVETIATGHSTSRQAAQIAKEAEVGRLALGHYSIRYKEEDTLLTQAREVFPDTVLSNEGVVFIP